MGGVIPLIVRAGGTVTTLIVTDGSSTPYPGDEALLAAKQTAAHSAAAILGYDRVIQWQYPDMRLDTVPHAELSGAISSLVAEEGFDTVFAPTMAMSTGTTVRSIRPRSSRRGRCPNVR